MATRKKRVVTKTREVDEQPPDDLSELLAQYGSGYRVKIQRQSDAPPRNWLYVETMDLTPEVVEDVKERFGGGNYRGLVYDGVKYVRGGTMTFSIAGRAKREDDGESAATDRLGRLEAAVLKLVEKPEGGGIAAGVALVTSMIAALTPIIAPFVAKIGAGGGGADVVTTLQLMQDAETKGYAQGEQMGKLLAGVPTDGGIAEVAKQNLPVVLGLIRDQIKSRAPGTAPAASAPPVAIVEDARVQVDANPLPSEYDWLPTLRPFYPRIAAQADNDTDPTVIADFALSQMDPPLVVAIQAATKRDDFLPVMRGELASIAQTHHQWVEEFLGQVVNACREEADATTVPPVAKTTRTTKSPRK